MLFTIRHLELQSVEIIISCKQQKRGLSTSAFSMVEHTLLDTYIQIVLILQCFIMENYH